MAQGEGDFLMVQLWGAILVILGCGCIGFLTAASHKNEEKCLRQFISALDHMECEIRFVQTPLPELCRKTALVINGPLRDAFISLASELDDQIAPDVNTCVSAVLQKTNRLPELTKTAMELLGSSLGNYCREGQLTGIESVRAESKRLLEIHTNNQDARIRSYQALGLCAGAAIAILFI